MDRFCPDGCSFESMIDVSNIFACWDQFKRGKKKKKDVQEFERFLEDNIFALHDTLLHLRYKHGPYENFTVFEPKRRNVSKACIQDRLVHHMVYSMLIKVYDSQFFFYSLSCRRGKGVHVGVNALQKMVRQVSHNGKLPWYALKIDVKRFFDHVDHSILKTLLKKRIIDSKILLILHEIIDSFCYTQTKGLPLGNVTSQLFANLYLHEFDLFVKHKLRLRYYQRYCDDCVMLANSCEDLATCMPIIEQFIWKNLCLKLHPQKIIFAKGSQGIDWLGYHIFLDYCLVRNSTKKRIIKRLILIENINHTVA